MASQRNYDLENHLRILIHTIATSTNKTTAGVEADFAGQIGMSTKTFQNFYRSKARYDERVIKVLLQNAARCPYPVSYTHLDVYKRQGLPSTVRQRRGIDVAAGCGQLAGTR